MSYSYKAYIKVPEGGEREIYVHAGEDVDSAVVDSIAQRLEAEPGLLFDTSWSDYLSITAPYNNEVFRLYEDDKWTFTVER